MVLVLPLLPLVVLLAPVPVVDVVVVVEGAVVMLMLPVEVAPPVSVELMVSSPADSSEQTEFPAFCAWTSSAGLQALSKQLRAAPPMADLVGPHWHETSFKLQPA